MNPANATALYVSACRAVLLCEPRDPRSLAELCRQLPFFRHSLSCLVCGNLLQDPMAPTNSSCQHYVCKGCRGQKMVLKPPCSCWKNPGQFQESRQLCLLVESFRKLCEFIAGSALGCYVADQADLLPTLSEGLSLSADEANAFWLSLQCSSPAPSISEDSPTEIPEPTGGSPLDSPDRLQGCNGLLAEKERDGGLPPLPEEGGRNEAAVDELATDGINICGLSEEPNQGGGQLMLTVEEVLRTLEPELGTEGCAGVARSLPQVPGTASGSPNESLQQPSLALTPRPSAVPRPTRKRSRSESDSEKVRPLPISSIIQGPPPGAAAILAEPQRELAVPAAPPLATVPNGGAPKACKALLVPAKGVRRNLEARKAHGKARPGLPKARDKVKERTPNGGTGTLMAGAPPRAVYKKPQEKRGCKCGRATQNPSVLTCRGQRCPCYSNRKACLDCVCRGCQNSYMANGEKKLEAFAVPEKALEQTRLTLGINVTSIAMRGTPAPGVLSVTAGGPVASFLAAGSREDKGFDNSLNVSFD
ncbi:E3 ubiquitin-protein ligase MSL2-like isoform X2 [Brienomyrus brachyistius]|uniref:E3 ubiquitin-protein ligase MSL2-like isoform X2 n=1 Tax=Brienomyrus brachyistius TaxID=42636 RepID=UPI0020B40CA8|nr:E3 ubiquitin-protein ligase MSL2-like isoform X2 [Brienomyrus brachyistius]